MANQGVPRLSLPTDDSDFSYKPCAMWDVRLNTPSTASTVSWGISARPKPAASSRPSPPAVGGKAEREVEPLKPAAAVSEPEDDDAVWVMSNRPHLRSIHDPDEDRYWKQKEDLLNTILVDQLSRAVMCDAGQSHRGSSAGTGGARAVPDANASRTIWNKGSNRGLHQTSVNPSASSMTEMALDRRVQFDCRILSRDPVALKEVSGVFFHHDNSLVVYELREFGKHRYSSLPFIDRRAYGKPRAQSAPDCHGDCYTVADIYVNSVISVATGGQPALPQHMKDRQLLHLRITSFDEKAKLRLLQVKESKFVNAHRQSHEDKKKNELMQSINTRARHFLRGNPLKLLSALVSMCDKAARLGNNPSPLLPQSFYTSIMIDFDIPANESELTTLWSLLFSHHATSRAHWEDFLRLLFGELNEEQLYFLKKAFLKVDPTRTGTANWDNVEKFCCLVGSVDFARLVESDVFYEFKDWFGQSKTVQWADFCDYYFALSVLLDNSDSLLTIIRKTWGLN